MSSYQTETLHLYDEEQRIHSPFLEWTEILRKNAGWLIAFGVLEAVLGFGAIAVPFVAGIAVTVFLGALLILAGAFRLVRLIKARSFGEGIWAVLGSALALISGVVMLALPLIGLASLALVLGCYFLIQGIASIMLAFRIKPYSSWRWLLLDGMVTVILAGVILGSWPLSGLWVVGVLIGIDLIVSGIAAVAVGSVARKALAQSPSLYTKRW